MASCEWRARSPWGRRGVGPLAGVHVDQGCALLAPHVAAPVELALALGDPAHRRRVEAPSAAHDAAAVRPHRRLVALAARRAQRPCVKSSKGQVRSAQSSGGCGVGVVVLRGSHAKTMLTTRK